MYVWEDGQIMPCKLCMYEGKKLVEHYVMKHSDTEVLISRLERNEALRAMLQPRQAEASMLQCRFCHGSFSKMTDFQDHVAEHTGEYRYLCTFCVYKKPRCSTVVQHMKTVHGATQQPEFVGEPIECETNYLPGFLCGFCNFVQMSKKAVLLHIDRRHRHESGAACTPGLDEVNEINMVKSVVVEDEEDRKTPSPKPVVKVEAPEEVRTAPFYFLANL